ADDAMRVRDVRAVGHQRASSGCLLCAINPGHAKTRSKRCELVVMARKKPIRGQKQCSNSFLRNRFEDLLEFAWVACLQNREAQSPRARCLGRFSCCCAIGGGISWVHK